MDEPAQLVLGPLLRWTDRESATVWVEVSAPCTVTVCGSAAHTFQVAGRYYSIVVVRGLAPGSCTPYDVRLDDRLVWPPGDAELPASVIRTTADGSPVRIVAGSCRAAAPHEPPYTLDLAFNVEGRGVDTLWAHAHRMMRQDASEWPTLAVFLGDQIYADDTSPQARERIEERRADQVDLESSDVYRYEEYCWLYHEAWSSPTERWFLSTVPSAMIFDDHDMIDDWNISADWLREMSADSTWIERATNGYMSYWVYQHLGNLSPDQLATDALLAALLTVDDGTEILREWAQQCLRASGTDGGVQFSHVRDLGGVTLITIDCRSGRVLDGSRRMVQPSEWSRIVEWAMEAPGHVVLVSSVPVFLPDGIHDLHTWNSRVCDGAWGARGRRLGERVRRGLDLEDWPAFPQSMNEFVALIRALRRRSDPPRSVVVLSGDIHFSYAARVGEFDGEPGCDVWQIVSSPIRNALIPHERSAMRLATTRAGALIGAALRRLSRGRDSRPAIDVVAGPFFANNMVELRFDDAGTTAVFEHSTSAESGEDPELSVVGELRW
jgi:hypothetical protein